MSSGKCKLTQEWNITTPIRMAKCVWPDSLGSGPGCARYTCAISQTPHLWELEILLDRELIWNYISIGQNGGIPGPSCPEQLNILLFTQAQRSVRLTVLSSLNGKLKLSTFRFSWPIQATGALIFMEEKINVFCYLGETHCSLGIDLP